MIRSILLAVAAVVLFPDTVLGQQGQLSIPRVDLMPDRPQPYVMRDWDDVAARYDDFIFDRNKTGKYLPVVSFREKGINDPLLQPTLLDTYIGTASASQAEAINIIPAIVGASLLGIDKSLQAGVNWVEKTKDFFNSKNGQNVYLNGYDATSGHDWWYDLMPNVFFYQLSALYDDPDYESQFVTVADRWLAAVNAMGAKETPWTVPVMNYRGWYLSSMTGNTNGVREPEAAGAIGWLLHQAWLETGERQYLVGAQHALEYLTSLTSNPSYELQLPYGTLTAAKLNATAGTGYDIGKLLNWSFERGPLRGWGTIVGTWNGKDVSGLIGEANDAGNDYAFLMNGFQQAAALAPVIKYDKRYARAIAKWILNLANASRLFYPAYLDPAKQDDYQWSQEHDPNGVVAYEALKENWQGKALYGTGDAKRNGWAATNLGLYGSSHVGYLAAVIDPTDVESILRIDLQATDFRADKRYPQYAYFNPFETEQQVTVSVGTSPSDIYESISETVIANDVTGDYLLSIPAGEVVIITLLPGNAELTPVEGELRYNDFSVDYHYGYDFTPAFRIKSLASAKSAYEFNEPVALFATVDNAAGTVTYKWFVNGEQVPGESSALFQWTAPSVEGTYSLRVEATSGDETLSDTVQLQISADIPEPPVVMGITAEKQFYYESDAIKLHCAVESAGTEYLTYEWEIPTGTFVQNDSVIVWTASEGLYDITCTVTNSMGLSAEVTRQVLVKNNTGAEITPIAYYPLNINTLDYIHDFDAEVSGTSEAADARGNASAAYRIATTDDMINVPNALTLNFVDRITVSCWFKISPTGREAFILSHGSWEERWKISVTADQKIRWTVKTASGVKDLDSMEPVSGDAFYHITATYTGYSLELYINGTLDNYVRHHGPMLTTDDDITFGQKSTSDRQYFLNGVIDEVKIFNDVVQPWQIAGLKDLWMEENVTAIGETRENTVDVYPNPVTERKVFLSMRDSDLKGVRMMTCDGRTIPVALSRRGGELLIEMLSAAKGLFILELTTTTGIRYFKLSSK